MLILAATPIGNLGDATRRLIESLEAAPVVAAEDTRVAAKLLQLLGVENRPRLVAVNEHTEQARAAELLSLATESDVVLVTDAGMPTVSDPGFALVRAAAEAGVVVTALPGASAVTTALAVAGLPTDRFVFEGFLPRKAGDRGRRLAELAAERRTMVFFESPNRLAALLAALAEAFGGDRRAVVCRELTKLHEEIRRGPLVELARWAEAGVRGEIVVVVGGAPAVAADPAAALAAVQRLVGGGERLADAASRIAAETGLARRDLYEAALAARAEAHPRS